MRSPNLPLEPTATSSSNETEPDNGVIGWEVDIPDYAWARRVIEYGRELRREHHKNEDA